MKSRYDTAHYNGKSLLRTELPVKEKPRGDRSTNREKLLTDQSRSSPAAKFFFSSATVVVALHIYAGFFPSSTNWGFHHVAFFGTSLRFLWIFAALLVLVPFSRRFLLRLLEKIIGYAQQMPKAGVAVNLVVAWGVLCWIGRSHWHLLGDGALVLRTIKQVSEGDPMPLQFKTEPLATFINLQLYRTLNALAELPAIAVFWVIGVVSGVTFLMFAIWFVKKLELPPIESTLVVGLLIFSGSSQLFFGYVEDYAILYTILFLYLISGHLFLVHRCSIALPSIAFGLAMALHFSGIFFLPTYGFLILQQFRRNWMKASAGILLTLLTSGFLLYLIGYPPREVLRTFTTSEGHLKPMFTVTKYEHNYPFFSWEHAIDFLNLQMLLVPFVLLLGLTFVVMSHRKFRWTKSTEFFLLIALICGFAFLLVVNPNLGLSRDWDLFASFSLPLTVFVIVLLVRYPVIERRNELLFGAVILTFLHSTPWIAINASEERAIRRHLLLRNETFWGKVARMTYFEELAIHYREHKMYEESVEAYRQYLHVDSLNPRIHLSLAHVFELKGEKANQLESLETGVRLGSQKPEALLNLGSLVAEKEDIDRAIELTLRAIKLNPKLAIGYYNLGVYYYQGQGDCRRGLEFFDAAFAIDSSISLALKAAAAASLCLEDLDRARLYFNRYLQREPEDPDNPRLMESLTRH